MKFKSKLLFVLLASIVFVYAGCKKSSTKPAVVNTISQQDAASQVAITLNESLFSDQGAFDLSDGLGSTSGLSVRLGSPGFALHPNKSVFSLHTTRSALGAKTQGRFLLNFANPLCGSIIDTAVNETDTELGLTLGIVGEIKVTFNCTNDVVSGFTTVDNVTVSVGAGDSTITSKVGENLTLAVITPSDPNSNFSLNGTLNSSVAYTATGSSTTTATATFNYTLNSVIVDQSTGSALSGSVAFNTTATGEVGTWNYSGTITFLGNGSAKVTINGSTYTVNLDTGVVS